MTHGLVSSVIDQNLHLTAQTVNHLKYGEGVMTDDQREPVTLHKEKNRKLWV